MAAQLQIILWIGYRRKNIANEQASYIRLRFSSEVWDMRQLLYTHYRQPRAVHGHSRAALMHAFRTFHLRVSGEQKMNKVQMRPERAGQFVSDSSLRAMIGGMCGSASISFPNLCQDDGGHFQQVP